MKYFIAIALIIFLQHSSFCQNVGIGVPVPAHKLDVNGNINLTGGIRAAGTAGTEGQVLRANSSGNIYWSDFSQYPNFSGFFSDGSWVVPAGVTKILVEAWGGGAGGYTNSGGGGGAYIIAGVNVTPGATISFTIGTAGNGGSAATNGGSTITTIGSSTVTAGGGYAAPSTIAYGGSFSIFSSGTTIIGYDGEEGQDGAQLLTYAVGYNGSAVIYNSIGGHGGDAGNAPTTGGVSGIGSGITGNTTLYSGAFTMRRSRFPGGGGCVNGSNTTSTIYNRGSYGKMIIHY